MVNKIRIYKFKISSKVKRLKNKIRYYKRFNKLKKIVDNIIFNEKRREKIFSKHNFNNDTVEKIKSFIKGDIEISSFVIEMNENNEIIDFLEWIVECVKTKNIPIKRRTIFMKDVNKNKPFEVRSETEIFIKKYNKDFIDIPDEWKNKPLKVKEYLKKYSYLTALGAYMIHTIVADIYYQIDQNTIRTEKYHSEFEFCLDVLPNYLAGGREAENYISKYIISKYPLTMRKGERKKLIKEEIKLAFKRDCSGYPRWIQMPEWPIKNNEPMIYTGQKAFKEYSEYYFRDKKNEKCIITQWW